MTTTTSDGIRERQMRDLGYDVEIEHTERGRVVVMMAVADLDEMFVRIDPHMRMPGVFTHDDINEARRVGYAAGVKQGRAEAKKARNAEARTKRRGSAS